MIAAGDNEKSGADGASVARSAAAKSKSTRAQNAKLDGVAMSLRRVYQTAIDETVPDEMLDLLKRLG